MNKKIAYQGVQGAYSEQACKSAYPDYQTIACDTFQEAMWMVEEGDADLAMIPLENSTAGRVEEIYRLIPKMSLHVIAEHFEPIVHCLLALPGVKIEDLKYVASHPQALAQCHNHILSLGLKAEAKLDTAGAAKELVELNDPQRAAIASKLAADIYGLQILKENFEDKHGNTTRFFILSRENKVPLYEPSKKYITSLIFQVQNIPAALYKVLGGFASNGINLLKIESYMGTQMLPGSQFHIDIDGHMDSDIMRLALKEVSFFAEDVRILGVYESHRDKQIEYMI
ncbi:prephenate dehydratase [Sulfurovum sp. TSL6]|uniref:prephenate dehydratase n=1 Tax=Sulfurovum sp. TSL6 TaxID=2826995 RepID=UPI001CC77070|nr:prephenate dehydratase [Sulfurovum sp. TSL6]GIU00676.1 prephenate dehydratase [Sulfurovum sp. TSL6]